MTREWKAKEFFSKGENGALELKRTSLMSPSLTKGTKPLTSGTVDAMTDVCCPAKAVPSPRAMRVAASHWKQVALLGNCAHDNPLKLCWYRVLQRSFCFLVHKYKLGFFLASLHLAALHLSSFLFNFSSFHPFPPQSQRTHTTNTNSPTFRVLA